jgi:hypothetical protein
MKSGIVTTNEDIRGHIWPKIPVTVNKVMMATVILVMTVVSFYRTIWVWWQTIFEGQSFLKLLHGFHLYSNNEIDQ